tara:strand:- start:101 stop:379 length:279 start_codon:yes stop_codon:yes gene_type:complete
MKWVALGSMPNHTTKPNALVSEQPINGAQRLRITWSISQLCLHCRLHVTYVPACASPPAKTIFIFSIMGFFILPFALDADASLAVDFVKESC